MDQHHPRHVHPHPQGACLRARPRPRALPHPRDAGGRASREVRGRLRPRPLPTQGVPCALRRLRHPRALDLLGRPRHHHHQHGQEPARCRRLGRRRIRIAQVSRRRPPARRTALRLSRSMPGDGGADRREGLQRQQEQRRGIQPAEGTYRRGLALLYGSRPLRCRRHRLRRRASLPQRQGVRIQGPQGPVEGAQAAARQARALQKPRLAGTAQNPARPPRRRGGWGVLRPQGRPRHGRQQRPSAQDPPRLRRASRDRPAVRRQVQARDGRRRSR